MKKFVFASALLLSLSAFAQPPTDTDQPKQEAAPADIISNAKEMCTAWAKDDGIEQEQLNEYLLNCVNNELSYDNYQPVDSLN